MPRISDEDYNRARKLLKDAGSESAAKSHKKHGTRGGSPEGHGKQLLAEARDEFREKDGNKSGDGYTSGMTNAHAAAIWSAAAVMGVASW